MEQSSAMERVLVSCDGCADGRRVGDVRDQFAVDVAANLHAYFEHIEVLFAVLTAQMVLSEIICD